MAQVLPAERGLRRVIGDGESVPDGCVDGLDESDFLELYRQLVLLRTYDERSLVYHRQGRIGTYAIFFNHEAMQGGAVCALAEEDWIFPGYRPSPLGRARRAATGSRACGWTAATCSPCARLLARRSRGRARERDRRSSRL